MLEELLKNSALVSRNINKTNIDCGGINHEVYSYMVLRVCGFSYETA